MPCPFPCSPVIRECSWKKTQIKKNNNLGLENVKIERAHRIGDLKVYTKRTIVAKLSSYKDKQILRKCNQLSKKCLYSGLFWSVFSRIRTEYGEIRSISPYSVRIRENKDQNNSEYGHFSRSDWFIHQWGFFERDSEN